MDRFELRPAERSDIASVGALVRRSEAHDGVPRVLADEELAQDLAAPHLDLATDTRVAVCDGDVIGWTYVWHPPSTRRLDRAELFGDVEPVHRGRGVGRALVEWGIDRARERMAGRGHDLPRFIRVNAYDWLDDRHRLYRRAGFHPVRWHDELMRALDDLPPAILPAGVTLLPWPSGRDQEILDVRNAAFADHWGSTVVEPEQWHDFVYGHGARRDLSVVAVDQRSGEVIGLCVNHAYPEDDVVTGRRDGWIANVATQRAARGRGVASAMIASSLAAFAAAGFSHALLDVDADNPTGAASLYRSLGFRPHQRSITQEIEIGR